MFALSSYRSLAGLFVSFRRRSAWFCFACPTPCPSPLQAQLQEELDAFLEKQAAAAAEASGGSADEAEPAELPAVRHADAFQRYAVRCFWPCVFQFFSFLLVHPAAAGDGRGFWFVLGFWLALMRAFGSSSRFHPAAAAAARVAPPAGRT